MRYGRVLLCPALLLTTVLLFQSTLRGQVDPQAVFERCSQRIAELTQRCREANFEVARNCVVRIRELLAAGERVAAARLARQCIEQINENTRNGIARIRELCEQCIELLQRLNAPELAVRLRLRCERSVDAILDSRERAIGMIRAALGSDSPAGNSAG